MASFRITRIEEGPRDAVPGLWFQLMIRLMPESWFSHAGITWTAIRLQQDASRHLRAGHLRERPAKKRITLNQGSEETLHRLSGAWQVRLT